jgi:hypothetical protein
MDEIITKTKETDSIFEVDPLNGELRILNWIFFQLCKDQQNTLFEKFSGTT